MDKDSVRQMLSNIAIMSNRLGHESTGELKAWAFRTKVDAVSELITRGWAMANCTRANGLVGVSINSNARIHVPLHLLHPEVRARIRQQTQSIRVTAPLSECLDVAQRESLSQVTRPVRDDLIGA